MNNVTFDIHLSDDNSDECKGFKATIQECRDWISMNRHSNRLSEYSGGTVSIVSSNGVVIYLESIPSR